MQTQLRRKTRTPEQHGADYWLVLTIERCQMCGRTLPAGQRLVAKTPTGKVLCLQGAVCRSCEPTVSSVLQQYYSAPVGTLLVSLQNKELA